MAVAKESFFFFIYGEMASHEEVYFCFVSYIIGVWQPDEKDFAGEYNYY